MNYRMIQRELDLAAEELDRKGHRDLADQVDYFNERLSHTDDPEEIEGIKQALKKIDIQARRRDRGGRGTGRSSLRARLLRRRLAQRSLRSRPRSRLAARRRLLRDEDEPRSRLAARRLALRRRLAARSRAPRRRSSRLESLRARRLARLRRR